MATSERLPAQSNCVFTRSGHHKVSHQKVSLSLKQSRRGVQLTTTGGAYLQWLHYEHRQLFFAFQVCRFRKYQRLNCFISRDKDGRDIPDSRTYLNIMGSFDALHAKSSQFCALHCSHWPSFVRGSLVASTGFSKYNVSLLGKCLMHEAITMRHHFQKHR